MVKMELHTIQQLRYTGQLKVRFYPMGHPVYRQLEKVLFLQKKIIPDQMWPTPENDTPWEQFPSYYSIKLQDGIDHYTNHRNSEEIIDTATDSVNSVDYNGSAFQDSQDLYLFSNF